jgi:hypothetical protein
MDDALACLQKMRDKFDRDPPVGDHQFGYMACLDEMLRAITRPLVDEALEETAAAVLRDSGAPIVRAEELLAALTGPAMRAIMEMRIEQIVKFGHTAETDVMHPITWLPKQTIDQAQMAHARIGVTEAGRNLPAAMKASARAGACAAASIDRVLMAIRAGG